MRLEVGAVAFQRTGEPDTGKFEDAEVIGKFSENARMIYRPSDDLPRAIASARATWSAPSLAALSSQAWRNPEAPTDTLSSPMSHPPINFDFIGSISTVAVWT